MNLNELLLGTALPKTDSKSNLFLDIGTLIPRLVFGLTLAFAHGTGKIPPAERFVEAVGGMGFPLPVVFAWAASLSEFAGGILLALGLFTRPAAFFVAFTMAVAMIVAHGADPFQKKELSFLYFSAATSLLLLGSGRLSLDALLRAKVKR